MNNSGLFSDVLHPALNSGKLEKMDNVGNWYKLRQPEKFAEARQLVETTESISDLASLEREGLQLSLVKRGGWDKNVDYDKKESWEACLSWREKVRYANVISPNDPEGYAERAKKEFYVSQRSKAKKTRKRS